MKPWPITVGILVDTVGSVIFGAAYVLAILGLQGAHIMPTGDELSAASHMIIADVLGMLLTALGGFVAARMAGTLPVRHGVAVGVGGVLIWLAVEWVLPITSDDVGVWYDAASAAGSVLAGALGGWLAGRRPKKLPQPASGV